MASEHAWPVLAINSGVGRPSSALLTRVRRSLAADPRRCELAYFHHPAFSSESEHGSDERMRELWRVLYGAGVDVVLKGHEHNYERFAQLDAAGRPNARWGMREFVGTGGGTGSMVSIRDPRFAAAHRRSVWGAPHATARTCLCMEVRVDGRTLDCGRTECHR